MGYSHQNRYDGAPDPAALWNLLEDLRENVRGYLPFQVPSPDQIDRPRQGSRPTPDVHTLVLGILADGPRHGGQVVREIAGRDGGTAPGAAEIYPELQLLVDEGLATVEETDGRRTFTLTEAGHAESADAAADEDSPAPWDSFTRLFEGRGELPKAGVKLGQAVHQAGISGSEEQRQRVATVLDETRRRIYGILAEETGDGADGAAED